jgi:hypothetical protein
MNEYEKELLNDKNKLSCLHNLLSNRQFSEEFLKLTVGYYDSWKCLRTQNNLSPYFCFRYMYDNDTDSADNWTDYYDVLRYLKKTNTYTDEFIEQEFYRAMKDRGRIKE